MGNTREIHERIQDLPVGVEMRAMKFRDHDNNVDAILSISDCVEIAKGRFTIKFKPTAVNLTLCSGCHFAKSGSEGCPPRERAEEQAEAAVNNVTFYEPRPTIEHHRIR
jgi:hypothetical protein